MQEMLSYHVEFKEFSSLVVKRSFKIYLEQFDVEKNYLLRTRSIHFLELTDKNAESAVEGTIR